MSLAQKGFALLHKATQDISFGSPETDFRKKFNTNCVLYCCNGKWKTFEQRDKAFRNFYKKLSKEYNDSKNASAAAAKQANKAANIANYFGNLFSKKSIQDYCDKIEDEIYEMKYKRAFCSKKRKPTTVLNNIYKKKKYNQTIRTNFDNWDDFTSYLINEQSNNRPKVSAYKLHMV